MWNHSSIGTKIAIQLNHAGASAMESRIGIQPVSASATPNKAGGAIPHALTGRRNL